MNEQDFWLALSLRFNQRQHPMQPSGWCDGFQPKKYYLGGPSPRVTGTVAFVDGTRHDEFEFVVFLATQAATFEELACVDWAESLPPEDPLDWYALTADRTLEIYARG